MEEYFHLNLTKFLNKRDARSRNGKPSTADRPGKVANPVAEPGDNASQAADSVDNTDPYK